MSNKGKKWFGVTRSPEEDLALVDMMMSPHVISTLRLAIIVGMSALILVVYLTMNFIFYPAYPVVTPFAEDSEVFSENYPPFRMHEWVNYSISKDIVEGDISSPDSFARNNPIGFSFIAAPFVARWDERGIFIANAFIVWASALVFFFLMLELVEYQIAVACTLILAFATPNIFYASSAFGESAAQLMLLLSILFFVKGMFSQHEWVFYTLSGICSGLLLFFMPSLTVVIILYVLLLILDRGRFSFHDRNTIGITAGFITVFIVFLVIGKITTGAMLGLAFPRGDCLYNLTAGNSPDSGRNLFYGLWSMILGSPQGYVFILPLVSIIPLGLLSMWRNEFHSITYIVGIILLYHVLIAALSPCPVTGESLGARQLVPVIPLMVLPLAFVWREQTGERIWVAVLLVMSVYMCSFGWWAGKEQGKGFFIGVLHDHDAGKIIQARKGTLKRVDFRSTNELTEKYIDSLEKRDIGRWLGMLAPEVLHDIEGVERHVFSDLCSIYAASDSAGTKMIQSADPNSGIVPRLPELQNHGLGLPDIE